MPPEKEDIKDNNLLDDLDKLDTPEVETPPADGDAPAPENEDAPAPEPEPELSIVDKFVNGDMDGVRQSVQDQVIKTVSDIVNGVPEPEVDPDVPAPEVEDTHPSEE